MVSPSISYLGDDPSTVHRLNACAYQQSALTTGFGFQYAAFYIEKEHGSSRLVTLARRRIDDASLEAWQHLTFHDYEQTTDDGHNTISIGICSADGTIHIAFDHHSDPLKYRVSRPGLAKDARSESWVAESFGPICKRLPGISNALSEMMEEVTYPRFIDADDRMFLEYRVGKAGAGSDVLFVYDPSSAQYHFLGIYLIGNACNPYPNGVSYHRQTRSLHVTWTNRHFIEYEGATDKGSTAHKAQAGPNGPENNEGLYHAAHEIDSTGWGSFTEIITTLDSNNQASGIHSQHAQLRAKEIPRNSGIMNQEAQFIDDVGGVHVLNRENTSGEERWCHYHSDASQGWKSIALPDICPTATGPRGKLVYFKDRDLALYVLPSNTTDELILVKGLNVASEDPTEFTTIWKDAGYAGEPLIDEVALRDHARLSVFIIKKGCDAKRKIIVLDFDLNDLLKE